MKMKRVVETSTPLIHICLLFFLLSAAQIPQRGGKYDQIKPLPPPPVLHLRFNWADQLHARHLCARERKHEKETSLSSRPISPPPTSLDSSQFYPLKILGNVSLNGYSTGRGSPRTPAYPPHSSPPFLTSLRPFFIR